MHCTGHRHETLVVAIIEAGNDCIMCDGLRINGYNFRDDQPGAALSPLYQIVAPGFGNLVVPAEIRQGCWYGNPVAHLPLPDAQGRK